MKRGVLYLRYSAGSNQTEQSIEGQRRVCTEYATAHGIEIVGEYVDRHMTGTNDNRPDFQRMIADRNKGIYDAVIVYKTDRFARDKYDSAIYKKKLKDAKIEIRYAAESIPDGPEGIILESLLEGLAEYYSVELSQKIRRGMRESASKGKVTGGGIALGYDIGPEKRFVINANEAEIVRLIFEMYIKGDTNAAICRHLNDRGLRTSRGNKFSQSSIPRIIKNEKYMGVYKCGDYRTEGAVPAIVSKEVFYMAQKRREKNKTRKASRAPKANYLLAGKLYCGHCRRDMVGVSGTGKSGKKYYYYYCPASRGRRKDCDKKQVGRDWLENLVVEETVKYILQPGIIHDLAKRLHKLQAEAAAKNDTTNFYKQKLSENKRAIANTLRAIEAGVTTRTLPERIQELEIEQITLMETLERIKSHNTVLTAEKIKYLLMEFTNPGDDPEAYKKKIIQCFVSSVYLYDGKLLIYYNVQRDQEELLGSALDFYEDTGVFDERCNASTSGQCPPINALLALPGALSISREQVH